MEKIKYHTHPGTKTHKEKKQEDSISHGHLLGLAGIVFALTVLSLIISGLSWKNIESISSFDQCVRDGFPVLKSSPASCQTPDGRVFAQQIPGLNENIRQLSENK